MIILNIFIKKLKEKNVDNQVQVYLNFFSKENSKNFGRTYMSQPKQAILSGNSINLLKLENPIVLYYHTQISQNSKVSLLIDLELTGEIF